MTTQQNTVNPRQALLLFIQEYRKEGKSFGFGNQLDQSVHRALINRTFDVLKQLNHVDIFIVKDGNIPHLDGAHYLPQRGEDLNSRFRSALEDTFALGYQRVVAIGGDIPSLHVNDIRTALKSDEIVIGPTADGGFYLAAITAQDLHHFNHLPWRQTNLFAALEQRIGNSGASYRQLKIRKDIDKKTDAYESINILMLLVKKLHHMAKALQQLPSEVSQLLPLRILEPRFNALPPPA